MAVWHGRRPRPSFETHRFRDAPQDEGEQDADTIRTSETLYWFRFRKRIDGDIVFPNDICIDYRATKQ
jgi:hypothetical protein